MREATRPPSSCWVLDDVCSFRFNRDAEVLTTLEADPVYMKLISPFLTLRDRERLSQLSSTELLSLNSQLSVHSSLVARELYMSAREREKDLSEMIQEKESLRSKAELRAKAESEEVTALRISMKAAEKVRSEEEKLHKAEVTKLQESLTSYKATSVAEMNTLLIHHGTQNSKMITLQAEFDDLLYEKNSLAKELGGYRKEVNSKVTKISEFLETFLTRQRLQAETNKDEMAKKDAEIRALQKNVEELKAEAALDKKTLEGHLQLASRPFRTFESSDEYQEVLIELGEVGFELFREEVIKKGLLTRAQLEKYNYLDAVDPPEDSAEGESSSKVPDDTETGFPKVL